MIDRLLFVLTLVSALGCGLMSGFFFAFSACVMHALARLQAAHGIAAMQSINVVVINPPFLATFFGTAVLCIVATVIALLAGSPPRTLHVLAGSVLYLVGTILVTIRFNVPLNNELAAVQADSREAAVVWARYLAVWTKWNHVRTVAALAAAAVLTVAVVLQSGGAGAWLTR
jgi:uncharacterized membrane protein